MSGEAWVCLAGSASSAPSPLPPPLGAQEEQLDSAPPSFCDATSLLQALSQAQAELSQLRAAATDSSLDLLEARSAHARSLGGLRSEFAARDAVISGLRGELEAAEQRALAERLAREAELAALAERNEALRLQLEVAEHAAAQHAGGGGGAAAQQRAQALSALEADIAALRAALEGARAEAAAAQAAGAAQAAAAARAEEEARSARAAGAEAGARARAAQEQLAGVLSRDAGEAARAGAAEAELSSVRAELDKRLRQLHRVVAALQAVQEREARSEAALEAQAAVLAQLQGALEHSQAEAERWRGTASVLQARHAAALDSIGDLEERLEACAGARAAEADVVASATRAAEAVQALSGALEVVRDEKSRLEAALGEARAEGRREVLALQRACEEKSALVAGLRADMAAAMASMGIGGAAPALLSPSGAAPGAAPGGAGGAAAEAAERESGLHRALQASQLANESLSRQLQQRSDRLAAVEGEVEDLLDVNDRLRGALESLRERQGAAALGGAGGGEGEGEGEGGWLVHQPDLAMALQLAGELGDRSKRLRSGGSGGASAAQALVAAGAPPPSSSSSSSSSPAGAALGAHLRECEEAFSATRSLLLAAHALAASVTAQLEGSGESSGAGGAGGSEDASASGASVAEASDAAVAMVTAQLSNTLGSAPRELAALLSAQHHQHQHQQLSLTLPSKLARLVAQGTAVLEAAQSELSARAAARLERECVTQ